MLRTLLPLLAACLAASAALAGTEIVTETQQAGKTDVRTSRALLNGKHLRIDDPASKRSIVYRGDEGVVWVIDHGRSSYIEFQQPDPAAAARQAQQRLDGLTPEKRAELERQTKAGVKLEKTGVSTRLLGIPCTEYVISTEGRRLADVCEASFEDAGIAPESFQAVRDVRALLENTVAAMMAAPELQALGATALASVGELDGVPLRVRSYQDDRLDSTTLVKQIENRKFPAADFELPEGYKAQFSIQIRESISGS